MDVYIYYLWSPYSRKPFYIGATRSPVNRLKLHVRRPKGQSKVWSRTIERNHLIEKILLKEGQLSMVIIMKCKKHDAGKWEKHYHDIHSVNNKLLQPDGRWYRP
jgi:hypothetical protein